jgi:signal transduction histidine kinase/CheY-like chemotaxis protein
MPSHPIARLKSQILIVIGVIVAGVVGVSGWTLVAERNEALERAEGRAAGFARAFAEHSESAFSDSDRMLRDLVREIRREGGVARVDPRALFDELRRQSDGAPQVGTLFVVGRDGGMLANSGEFPQKPLNVADRDYFRFYLAHPDADLTLGKPVVSRLVGRMRFNLMRPLALPGKPFEGLAAVAFEVDFFKHFLDPRSLGPRGRVVLIREDGAPLVYEPAVDNGYQVDFRNSTLFRERLPAAPSGTYRVGKGHLDGAPRITAYRRLSRFPVIAVVSMHQGDVLSPWRQRAALQGAVTAGLCLVVLLLTRLMFRHLDRLRQAQETLGDHLAILEEMATGVPLPVLLDRVVRFVEAQSPGALCSILLADEGCARLRHGAAPSLPGEYNEAVDGLRIREGKGSCGTAAARRARVVVEDIEGHPWWNGFDAARAAGLRSAWSEPILSSEGGLLGTFAVYHRQPKAPGGDEIALIESAAHLASIAISRVRGQEQQHRLEEQLRHIQKIEAIGQLAGGVAHDFNNLLTPIIVCAELARREMKAGSPLDARMEGVLSAAHKAKELTQKLLSFARKQMLAMTPVDLNRVIADLREMMRRTIRESIAIELALDPGGAFVTGDQGQIEQILVNLAVNAQDAIEGQGRIVIGTGRVTLDEEAVRPHPGLGPGAYVFLSFADDGCGMSDEVRKHVFEPFFTTKPVGEGTGLGLATVYGIVKQHDGYVGLESSPGAGSRFTLYFPDRGLAEAASPAKPAAAGERAEPPRPEKRDILVVEDNEMVRTLIVGMLETFDYRVTAVGSPEEAMSIAAEPGARIDLLVTDVVMPGMNGQALYERVAGIRPGLPVLFISGYTSDVVLRAGSPGERIHFLNKPFTLEDCLAAVRAALWPAAE